MLVVSSASARVALGQVELQWYSLLHGRNFRRLDLVLEGGTEGGTESVIDLSCVNNKCSLRMARMPESPRDK